MISTSSRLLICSILSCGIASVGIAQEQREGAPPPREAMADAGTYATVNGNVSQLNYNRNAEISGVLLDGHILVQLPPRLTRPATQDATTIHSGDLLQVSGMSRTSPGGFQTIDARDLKDKTSGKNFTFTPPGPPAPYSATGRIRQLNYGADGSINGFVLDNGTMANVPPFGAENPSSIKPGASVAVTGYARITDGGKTVLDVQTITLNGQPLALMMPADRRGPGGLPRPPREAAGPRMQAPPPPPAPRP